MGLKKLKWWTIYGPGSSGTSLMYRVIAHWARLGVSDWCLRDILKLVPDRPYIRFDKKRALKDISRNIIDNAHRCSGRYLDLVFKQACLASGEFAMLVEMWRKPERIIFCLREPATYMASTSRRWPEWPVAYLRRMYIETLAEYEKIGGDIFEYHRGLTIEDYINFVNLPKTVKIDEKFACTESRNPELADTEMLAAYENFRKKHVSSSSHRQALRG